MRSFTKVFFFISTKPIPNSIFVGMSAHHVFMRRCIELATNGVGMTSPNPLVGSVIVYKDTIIGEGWHRKSGEAHAEVNAINHVANQDLLVDSTLYVNLEPCCHYGKTPPCTDLIIGKGIKKVVIGSLDTSKNSRKGVQIMKAKQIEVIENVLESDCTKLNKRFFIFHHQRRPYIILKWAKSTDGFMDILDHTANRKKPFWISNSYSRQLSHRWRTEEDAILVGTTTALSDNPNLNARDWSGQNPTRIVIDRYGKLDSNAKLFNNISKTIVFTETKKKSVGQTQFIPLDFQNNIIPSILETLYENQIQSVIVEGGKLTIQSFLEASLWDEARVFSSDVSLKKGLKSPIITNAPLETIRIGKDKLSTYYRKNIF